MSNFSNDVYDCLKKIFPHYTILKEYYINYQNTRLFFDFFIRELGLFFEVQGDQHEHFNKFFHEDKMSFAEAKKRDNLKKEWIEKKDFRLIEIKTSDKIEESYILEKIYNELGYKKYGRNTKKRYNNPKTSPAERIS